MGKRVLHCVACGRECHSLPEYRAHAREAHDGLVTFEDAIADTPWLGDPREAEIAAVRVPFEPSQPAVQAAIRLHRRARYSERAWEKQAQILAGAE